MRGGLVVLDCDGGRDRGKLKRLSKCGKVFTSILANAENRPAPAARVGDVGPAAMAHVGPFKPSVSRTMGGFQNDEFLVAPLGELLTEHGAKFTGSFVRNDVKTAIEIGGVVFHRPQWATLGHLRQQ
jgi:hypothetical protein